MNKNHIDLKFLIDQGEGYNLEFKERFTDRIAIGMCAFANANGGRIVLGVADDGTITGMQISNTLKSQIHDIARKIDPALNIKLETIQSVVIIEVPEGSNKPYSTHGKFYIRNGPNSQQLTREEIRAFFQQEGLVLFDEKPNLDFNLVNDLNFDAFEHFLSRAKISPVLETRELLDNLYLLKNDQLKNAGVLIFAKEVTRFFLQATITCVLYRGTTKYKILDRKEHTGDIVTNFKETMVYLESKLNTEFIIKGGPREEKLELPEDALREAVLNAIAHRDYFVSGANILVEIYSDRVEITNPGGLVKGLKLQDLGKRSMSRNNLLFGLLQRMGLVEKVGSGIVRMRNEMHAYGLDEPRFEIDNDWFTIIFDRPEFHVKKEMSPFRKRYPERVPRQSPPKYPMKVTYFQIRLTKLERKVLDEIIKKPSTSSTEIGSILGISPETVKDYISRLKIKGVIDRIGPPRGGYWKVIEDEQK